MIRAAYMSECGVYRYRLTRRWGTGGSVCAFVMLNPSTADGEHDDPTIRRCIGFADRIGCHALTVVNLFSFRATNPKDLKAALSSGVDVIGPRNDGAIHLSAVVACAWGNGGALGGRAAAVNAMIRATGRRGQCFGINASGQPKHPLYIRADAPLIPWP